MSDHETDVETSTPRGMDPLLEEVRRLVAQLAESRATWDRLERRAIPLLERIALALERGAAAPAEGSGPSLAAEVRAAIDDRRWDRAQAILDASPADAPGVEALGIELRRACERAKAELLARIESARGAGDADGAMVARDELARFLDDEALREVDRGLIGWLMRLVQRRLRAVPVGADLAVLAGAIAERFAGSPEGASLRAALPTLRRSAGLCPRCAEPYLGDDEACPKCLAAAGVAPTPPPTLTFVADDLDAVVADNQPLDLNDAQNWLVP